VKGIYLEKPMCRTLAEADEIAGACAARRVRLAIAHQTRYSPRLKVVREMISSGALGRVLELRARGKEDVRGGGEDLWVLGTHVLDLMHALGGAPQTCAAAVLQEGHPAGAADVQPGNEGIGPLAGDEIHATYRLAGGATGFFDSVRGASGKPSRFGLRVLGTKGAVEIFDVGFLPDVRFLDDPSWSGGRTGAAWVPVSSAGAGKPEPLADGGLHAGNVAAAKDLVAAIAEGREPEAGLATARTATEMIVAVFESHRVKGPVAFPLATRRNPLEML
jgi:predicted dehydrogenase